MEEVAGRPPAAPGPGLTIARVLPRAGEGPLTTLWWPPALLVLAGAGLALLAGAPAILGVWIGGFVYSPLWATVFLAIGAGAIAQVVVEVARLLAGSERRQGLALDWVTLGGITVGIALMYATSLVIAA